MKPNSSILYIKYGELCLKGKNIKTFKLKAYQNLVYALKKYQLKIQRQFDYIIIEDYDHNLENTLVEIIKRLPGFSYLTIAYLTEKNLPDMIATTCALLVGIKTFKMATRRIDKSFPLNSDEINRQIANQVLDTTTCKVDIHHPELKINIEIRKNEAVIFGRKIHTVGGLPVGSSGRGLVLLSGGIDSPVASHLMLKRGLHLDFLTFITPPHTSEEALNKVRVLVRKITNDSTNCHSRLYICNYTPIQQELQHLSNEAYRITILRRSFLRIANLLCDKYRYDCLITGDALGQVASQTIESLSVISEVSTRCVLRPLIAYDKQEIIDIAKNIDTYETSILPFDDACSLFAPLNPTTKPKLNLAIALEEEIDLLNGLETNIIDKIEIENYDQE